jgi:hypothetical protein
VGTTVKGTVVKAGHDYLKTAYGDAVWERVLERLTAEERRLVAHAGKSLQFPVAVDGRVFAAVVDIRFAGNRALAEHGLRRGGSAQADDMLDGVFSVFARYVSPAQAYSRAGQILTSVYSGVTHATEPRPDGVGGVLRIQGLGESHFVAPWQCGWMERALERVGARETHVTERTWAAGRDASDELVYDITWE